MRQMWLVGSAVLLTGVGYLGWLVFHSATAMPEAAPIPVSNERPPISMQPSPDVALRLHGSNTIGAQLAPMLAVAFLKAKGATDVSSKSTVVDEFAVMGTLEGKRSVIEIKAHGSATAFLDLASGECDIGMASRRIQAAEATNFASLGDMTSPASEHVLGLDGVAVIVNRSNSLSSLSKQNIARIFTGEVTDWKQVGGQAAKIKVYSRDAKSGTFDTFKSLVLSGKSLAANTARVEDSRELSKLVSQNANAIGFVGLPFVRDAKALAVAEDDVKALPPSILMVSTEDYPLSRRLYLYTASDPKNPLVRDFVEFALGKEGQKLVDEDGFVSLSVKALQVSVPADAPADYKRLAKGAQRLSVNFRFRSGSSVLDNRAMPDLDRVRAFLSEGKYSGANVLLFGFSDDMGNRDTNCSLAKDRATVLSEQLAQHGVKGATVAGFCSDLPVASNDTEAGRDRNRRVEIWVKPN